MSELRALHATGKHTYGLDMSGSGGVTDMERVGVIEALVVKRQMLQSAAEAAEVILRVDSILKAAPRQRRADQPGAHGGAGHIC